MSDKTVSVGLRFDGDAKGAQESVGQIRKGLTDLKTDGDKIKLLDGESVVARELSAELKKLEGEAKSLASASSRVVILDSAIASAERYKVKLTEANAEVRKIQATLSEAYNSGADKSLIKNLEKELTAAERAATSAGVALQGSTANIVRLNLAAGEAGITTGNLAAKKTELAETYQRLTGAIDQQSTAVKREAEYQAYLAQESERVAAAEKRVAESGFIEHQRQSAIQAQKTAEYTNFWVSALEKADAAEKKAERSSEALNASFAKLGIRSAHQIEADILQVNQELLRLAQRTDLTGAEFDRAFAAGQGKIKQLRAELNGASGDITQVAQRADGMISMMGKLGLAFSGAELARQFVMVNVELENMERTFRAITGSSQRAAAEMAYVHDVADRLGLPLVSTGKAYADLLAATKGTAVEGQATRAVFEAVAGAMSVAGKTSADTEGALLALSQMASKGVISMEELRGQLGERLPGALGAVADGLGITTAQLIKLVETGQLTAEELFPALATGLNKLYGASSEAGKATETLTQKWEHFKNGVADAFKTIGDAGAVSALKYGLEGLETVVVTTSVMIVALGKDIGVFFAALANGDIGLRGFSERAREAFAEVEKEAQDKLLKTAMHNRVMAGTLDESGKKALAAAQAQTTAGSATAAAGASAAAAGSDWTRLNVAFNAVQEAGEKATKQAVANTEARKAEGEAALELANAFGTEREKLLAKAEATHVDAAALGQLAERRREELAMAKGHLAAMEQEVAGRGKASEAQQKQIDELKKLVEARQAESDKAVAQAHTSAVMAAQSETEANAYADNSQRVGELKTAYEKATVAVDVLRTQKAAGVDVTRQLEAAEINAGQAASLYRDAIADQTANLRLSLTLKEGLLGVAQAGIRLAIEQQKTISDVARAQGDEYGATQALLQIKRLEIQLTELTAKQKRAEADTTLELVRIERQRLSDLGQLTAAKELELKAQEASARVKQVEGQIAEETASRMRMLTQVTDYSAGSAERAGKGYDDLAASLRGVAGAAEDASNNMSILNDKSVTGRKGNIDLLGEAYRRGATVDEGQLMKETLNELFNAKLSSIGKVANEGDYQLKLKVITNEAINESLSMARQKIAAGQGTEKPVSLADLQAYELSKTNQPNTGAVTYTDTAIRNLQDALRRAGDQAQKNINTVNITIGGKTKAVNVASASDADNLTAMLRLLESDAARAMP